MKKQVRIIDPEQMKHLDSAEIVVAMSYIREGHWVLKNSESCHQHINNKGLN